MVVETPVKFKVSAMEVGSSLRITVPKELASHLNIEEGDKVVLWANNSRVVLEKEKKA
jgi:AbrB family looped-hinge helix DNA binding protein